ncbi:TolB-like translocation protein [Rhodohalobacter halophilus]|uniref:PD40 domain-containing protein n=1 Tax=Rhodohalobacter halophilus TaxID=1812810 RepID=UPI00159F079C|nr:PD40 domain-containing protein [Rhodohalobacter halophilus]
MKKLFTYLTLFVIAATYPFSEGAAQIYETKYRLPNLNWQEINTERFRLIYPEIYRDEAIRSLSILESEYNDIQQFVGGELRRFPVIINPENDRSNGFVSPSNFRSEIELAPIRGKTLNPQSGDWLESVLPHELVHALHFSVNPPSISRILGLFSPDLRRSIHGAAPLGLHEGIAVDYESHGTLPYSGRGNYPYFTHQFNSLLGTDEQWSMGQLLHTTDFTPPFNRHYAGGYEFMNWLKSSYGEEIVQNTIRFHYKYPFLGYGVALRSKTGKWPAALYREFSADVSSEESSRLSSVNENNSLEELPVRGTCRRTHRPLWLDNSTLIFHGRFCNQPTGFYQYDLESRSVNLIKEVVVSDDYIYSATESHSSILFSRYHSDTRFDNVFRGDLHELNVQSGELTRITQRQRLFSPAEHAGQIYALRTSGQTEELVEVNSATGLISKTYIKPETASVIQVAPHPADISQSAIIGKLNGVQGIWFINLTEETNILFDQPDIVFESASIFDLSWHPDGNRLLFVSDRDGVMNLYEFNLNSRELHRLTNEPYNLFEASYSPDGSLIALIKQIQNEQVPAVISAQSLNRDKISPDQFQPNESVETLLNRPLMNRAEVADTTDWEFSSYRSGWSWLKPRLWLPTYDEQSGSDRIGITMESVDPLSSRRYTMEISHYLDRIWYDLEYTTKGFYPGFRANIFNEPNLTSFRVTSENESFTLPFLQQSRGASLKIPFRFYIERNARFTSLLLEPQYYVSQLRFLNPNQTSQSYSEFGTRHSVGLVSSLNYRLRQFRRDVQPNAGWIFFTETRIGLNNTTLNIQTDQFNIDANLTDRRGFRGYISTFIAPLSKLNQSLRLTGQVVTQTDLPVFNTADLYSDNFSDVPLPAVNNVAIFNTRYTIPITYPDDGGLTVPVYLSNIYLVLFSQTVADLNQSDIYRATRAVYGAGIRSRFRISNLAFDIGLSLGWEPTRDEFTFHFGTF